ncbi:hypothetical protein C8R43DRAFT_1193316 [Mycena crocata]|nr:hypothetical protein C8R43DRAFT_1193316 [Mycena crocata]
MAEPFLKDIVCICSSTKHVGMNNGLELWSWRIFGSRNKRVMEPLPMWRQVLYTGSGPFNLCSESQTVFNRERRGCRTSQKACIPTVTKFEKFVLVLWELNPGNGNEFFKMILRRPGKVSSLGIVPVYVNVDTIMNSRANRQKLSLSSSGASEYTATVEDGSGKTSSRSNSERLIKLRGEPALRRIWAVSISDNNSRHRVKNRSYGWGLHAESLQAQPKSSGTLAETRVLFGQQRTGASALGSPQPPSEKWFHILMPWERAKSVLAEIFRCLCVYIKVYIPTKPGRYENQELKGMPDITLRSVDFLPHLPWTLSWRCDELHQRPSGKSKWRAAAGATTRSDNVHCAGDSQPHPSNYKLCQMAILIHPPGAVNHAVGLRGERAAPRSGPKRRAPTDTLA